MVRVQLPEPGTREEEVEREAFDTKHNMFDIMSDMVIKKDQGFVSVSC